MENGVMTSSSSGNSSPIAKQRSRTHSGEKHGSKRSRPPPHQHHLASEREIKVAVVGAKCVGKSAISVRYLTKRFIGEYDERETVCSKVSTVEGKPTKVTVLDTNSCSSSDDYISWADGLMLVYSITSLTSFQHLQDTVKDMSRTHKDIPMLILVGNKCDLHHLRQVSQDVAARLADDFQCPYLEVSASDGYVDSAFTGLVREVVHKRPARRSRSKAAYKLISLKQTLLSLTDFRSRTNTM